MCVDWCRGWSDTRELERTRAVLRLLRTLSTVLAETPVNGPFHGRWGQVECFSAVRAGDGAVFATLAPALDAAECVPPSPRARAHVSSHAVSSHTRARRDASLALASLVALSFCARAFFWLARERERERERAERARVRVPRARACVSASLSREGSEPLEREERRAQAALVAAAERVATERGWRGRGVFRASLK